ncbi:hypothetical protein G6027_05895 [Dietzia sp. SLG310A2-38A2]|uniref:hypothetical protein n=1 Tax=Dietzia sp. SLG310A2-38A2 TaxID=1630643 RepID=UPI0015FBF7D8|nr:hypothetical protein [Dietzia sp. SLG310A2-38A2]MBB1030425.1 hypothetical protein [Dietzia sp. SLG310A2-38A2]
MYSDAPGRSIQVFVPSEVFQDGTLSPLHSGDVISVLLRLSTWCGPGAPGVATYRVMVHPAVGFAPIPDRDGVLRWPFHVSGDGWSAMWRHHTPVTARTSLTGRLFPDFHRGVLGHPDTVTGRVHRLQLVEQYSETVDRVTRFVEGTERLRDLGESPDRYWPDFHRICPDNSVQEAGILVDLALDDIPDPVKGFDAGAVSAHGTDVWVMDRSDPVLMQVDISRSPARVTEYLLPLAFERPPVKWSRALHADDDGCWITCEAEIVRCDHTGPDEVTVRRITTDGRDDTSYVDGRLFAMTQHFPSVRSHDRYDKIRFNPEEHPVHELVGDLLIPVKDEATIVRARKHTRRADRAEAADGTTWIASGGLSARTTDGSEHQIDLSHPARGTSHWDKPDPMDDPAIAELFHAFDFPRDES